MAMPNGLVHEAFAVALHALKLASRVEAPLDITRIWVDVYGTTPMPNEFTKDELITLLWQHKDNLASRLSGEVFKTGLLEQKLRLCEEELARLRPIAKSLIELAQRNTELTQQLLVARQQLNQVGFQKEGLRKAHRIFRSLLSSEASETEIAEALAALQDAAKN